MLYLARSLSQLHFGSLMAVYADANRENGRESWPEEPEMRISAESKELRFFTREEIGKIEIAVTHRDIIRDWFENVP